MTSKKTLPTALDTAATEEVRTKVVTPARVAMGAAIGSAAIAAAVLFAGRIGKPKG